ncbi:hypothetical protein MUN78_10215 [Leucobacter allii]|uniref:Uncharacterized protein n=1 Tax=Leucobacter allii TaxID=2932247 RepID=A0ABY4FHC3_9MICO|nr:hypothetical protein [Leucobacter allii]UOQ56078.1 hypothetical protein MUN78_10215 [Leucobacter allii]
MPIIRSPKYAQLRVHVGTANVKFRDGFAEVDEAVAAELVELPGFGLEISEPDEDDTDEDLDDDEDEDELDSWDEDALRAFATENDISLGKLQNVEKIRERIREALAAA